MTKTPKGTFVAVLLPLAIEKPYTYAVPAHLAGRVAFGMRVEVQFGKSRRYSGIIVGKADPPSDLERVKPLIDVLDEAGAKLREDFTCREAAE